MSGHSRNAIQPGINLRNSMKARRRSIRKGKNVPDGHSVPDLLASPLNLNPAG